MPNPTFYLGRWSGDDAQPVRYDPVDLTTHAVAIGMTGSGKTGLLIALLEEAARQGLPAIIIDPKGDLTNLLLHFPELLPADFAPWIDPETARRQGQTVDALAETTAARWRDGLAKWDLSGEDLRALTQSIDYTVYTPGSTAGRPVNLLSSFEAPANWSANRESERERISSTVTALLGLVGLTDVDPLRSREHILLSNIIESAWSQGTSPDLAGLIEQVTNPPFERLGAFPLERFFPEKERFGLALLLNNFLAAPSFQTWLEGDALDAGRLLYRPDGKARFSIFYMAHLSESERMFFVTLLLASVEGWMRAQRGTSGLRALLAFDEIVGYLPPVANPPSRPVLLRLLKQARAFGLGLLLATQNPVDLNYKALSNCGTWFIGRLQTEQDKNRLLDGLQSLDSGIDRSAFDELIARLGPRLFLLHNVHQPGPKVFNVRWVMNYLAGPLTRAQIPDLLRLTSTPDEADSATSNGTRSFGTPSFGETASGAKPADDSAAFPGGSTFESNQAGVPGATTQVSGLSGSPTRAPQAAAHPQTLTRPQAPAAQPSPLSSAPPPQSANSPYNSVTPFSNAASRPGKPNTASAPTTGGISLKNALGEEDVLGAGPHPILPAGTEEHYFPIALSFNRAMAAHGLALRGPVEPLGLAYRPALLAEAEIRYLASKYHLDETRQLACLLLQPGPRADWDAFARPPFGKSLLLDAPQAVTWYKTPQSNTGERPDARYQPLPGQWSTARNIAALKKDFLDWAYRSGTIYVHANEDLKLYAGPDTPADDFNRWAADVAQQGLQAAADKIAAGYDDKLDTLRRKIERQQSMVERLVGEVDQRKAEQTSTDFELLASVFSRRKRSLTTSLTKRRLTQQAQSGLEEARRSIDALRAEWNDLSDDRQNALDRVNEEWRARAARVSQVAVAPLKKDIYAARFGIVWLPVYLVKNPDGVIGLSAY